MAHETLWGRKADLASIMAKDEGVVLVVGDSGIGKSQLLSELDHGWQSTDLVAFPSVLGQLPGSLQAAIADAIAGCLARLAIEDVSLVRTVWTGLAKVIDKASAAGAKEATQLLLARIFKGIESKLGEDAATSTRAFLKDVLFSTEEDLQARLRALSSPDLGTVLLSLISEVSDVSGFRLVLLFDRGELLADIDLALLGELASRSTEAFLLVITMNSHAPGVSTKLTVLETRDAARHDLTPLSSFEIEEWLSSEEVPQSAWAVISRRSAGYPFFITELIAMSRDGKLDGPVEGPHGFDALLMESWKSLAPSQQSVAMTLACFPDPPSEELITALTGVDKLQWAANRLSLRESRVFVRRPDGTLWFHDRRRDFIWNRLMEPDDRAGVADAVIRELKTANSLTDLKADWLLVALPVVLRAEGAEVSLDEYLRELPKTAADELAVMFALLELREPVPAEGQAVETNAVVRHALSRLGIPADPISALEALASRGLALSHSDQSASVTVAIVPNVLALAALIAEMAYVLGRTPTPSLGSASFDLYMRPLLGDFRLATISVGEGSLRTHRDALVRLNDSSSGAESPLEMPSLGIVYQVEDQPITATIVFEKPTDHAAAEDALLRYREASGQSDMKVNKVRELPPARLPLARLVLVLKESGADVRSATLGEGVRYRVRLTEAIRSVLLPDEASAIDWTEPLSIVLDDRDGTWWSEVRVRGGSEASVEEVASASPLDLWRDPLIELKLRRDGYISPSQRVEGWGIYTVKAASNGDSPLKEVANELEKRANAYNDRLARIKIPVAENRLEVLLASSRRAKHVLMDGLIKQGILAPTSSEDDTSLYLFLKPATDGPLLDDWIASSYEFRDGKGHIRVRVLTEADPMPEYILTSATAAAHGLPAPELQIRGGGGLADHLIAPLLGWDAEDISLPRPSSLA